MSDTDVIDVPKIINNVNKKSSNVRTFPKPKKVRTALFKIPKKMDWSLHKNWLAKNAQHRIKRTPPSNPKGRFNQDQQISNADWDAFLSRNFKIVPHNSHFDPQIHTKKNKTISKKQFDEWYESKRIVSPSLIEPKRPVKSIKQLLKRIKKMSAPRKYLSIKPKSLKISTAALKFKAGKTYTRLSTPKKNFSPKIPRVIKKIITNHGMNRLEELSKPRPKQELSSSGFYLKRWLDIETEQPAKDVSPSLLNRNSNTDAKFTKKKQDINVFVMISKDSKSIIKPAQQEKSQKSPCTGQCRIEELAKPTPPVITPFKDRPTIDLSIPDRVLNHQPSCRIIELSKPKTITVPFEVAQAEKDAKSKALRDQRNQQRELKRQDRIRQQENDKLQEEWETEQEAQRENNARKKRKASRRKYKKEKNSSKTPKNKSEMEDGRSTDDSFNKNSEQDKLSEKQGGSLTTTQVGKKKSKYHINCALENGDDNENAYPKIKSSIKQKDAVKEEKISKRKREKMVVIREENDKSIQDKIESENKENKTNVPITSKQSSTNVSSQDQSSSKTKLNKEPSSANIPYKLSNISAILKPKPSIDPSGKNMYNKPSNISASAEPSGANMRKQSNMSATSKPYISSQAQLSHNASKISHKPSKMDKSASKNKFPEKVKSDFDYRSDLEENQRGGEFIERTRNPIQRDTYSTRK